MADITTTQEKDEMIASTTDLLGRFRQQIDHVRVQAELGKLDARDEAYRQLTIAQNACLAAEANLREVAHDLTATARTVRDGIEQLVDDVKKAIDAAENAIARG